MDEFVLPSVNQPIDLNAVPTFSQKGISVQKAKKFLKSIRKESSIFQDKMYAHNRYGVLVVLQGMDTAGKDSLIREVFKGYHPRGVVVHSFKTPSTKELKHDYLWRHYLALPEKGKFSIFNRSHYENVSVTKVHPNYLLNENIPLNNSVDDFNDQFWNQRYQSIIAFEKHLNLNGVLVLKFFLHISKEEQRIRLLRRLEKPKHQWKFSPSDLYERSFWDAYQGCYSEALSKTSTQKAPWFVVPSDDKTLSRLFVASTIDSYLNRLKGVEYPDVNKNIVHKIDIFKSKLSEK